MTLYGWIDSLQRSVSRCRAATELAIYVRNQCNCVIGYRLGVTADAAKNGEHRLARVVAPSAKTFIDVGANVGNWASEFLAHTSSNGIGLLFEPSISALDRLSAAMAGEDRVEIVPSAVGDVAGEFEFAEEPAAGETSSLVVRASDRRSSRRMVDVVTLDDAVGERGWDRVDFLKIDAEGYDLHVLRGAASLIDAHRISIIQFEYNSSWMFAGSTLTHAAGFLTRRGYDLFVLRPDGLHVADVARHGEYYRYSNYVAVCRDAAPLIETLVIE